MEDPGPSKIKRLKLEKAPIQDLSSPTGPIVNLANIQPEDAQKLLPFLINIYRAIPPTITDLHQTILIHILSHLSVSDKKRCKLVCRNWLDLITQHSALASNMVFRFPDYYISEHVPPHNVFINSTQPLYNLDLNYDHLPDVRPNCKESKDSTKVLRDLLTKIGRQTKILKIRSFTHSWKSLMQFSELEELHIENADVLQTLFEMPITIQKIFIETLHVRISLGAVETLDSLVQLTEIKANILEIKKNLLDMNKIEYFPVSDELKVLEKYEKITMRDVNLMGLEKISISNVNLCISIDDGMQFFNFTPTQINAFSDLKIKIVKPNSCWFFHGILNMSNLKNVTIHYSIPLRLNCKSCLHYLIQCCPETISIKFASNSPKIFYKILAANKKFKALEVETQITIDPTIMLTMNGISFSRLSPERFNNLQTLSISLVGGKDATLWKNWPTLSALQNLSLKIEFRTLKAMDYTCGIEILAEKCPNIRRFTVISEKPCIDLWLVTELLKGWQDLVEINLNFEFFIMSPHGVAQAFGENCKNLKKVIMEAKNTEARSIELVQQLFDHVESLTRIEVPRWKSFYWFEFRYWD